MPIVDALLLLLAPSPCTTIGRWTRIVTAATKPCALAAYGHAFRGVADRLLGIACVLLQRRELFNPERGDVAATA